MPFAADCSRREFIRATVAVGVGTLTSVALASDGTLPPKDAAPLKIPRRPLGKTGVDVISWRWAALSACNDPLRRVTTP